MANVGLMVPHISVDSLVKEFIGGGTGFRIVLCGPFQYLHDVKLLITRCQLFGRVLIGRTGSQGCIQLEQYLHVRGDQKVKRSKDRTPGRP